MNAPVDVSAVKIETPRLILRPFRQTDLMDLFCYASVDGVGQRAGWKPHETVEESEKILSMFIGHKKVLALEETESGRVIGSLGLEELGNLDSSFESLLGREIGYVLSRDYWGRGLMPEAVKAVVNYCFDTLGFDFLTCAHFIWNQQSHRVIEKCGFLYWKDILYRTNLGTTEEAKLYILHNPNKREVNHV